MSPAGPDGEAVDLWRRYALRPDPETRAALMLAYWPLVKEVAAGVASNMPGHVEEADLVSAGLFGLLSAIDRYDATSGSPFEGFARPRVRGSMIDELRSLDWAPRHVRERAREVGDAHAHLQQRLRRRATYPELARALGLTAHEVHARLARNLLGSVGSLNVELPLAGDAVGEAVYLIDSVEDLDAADPVRSLEDAELRVGVIEAIMRLPPREQRVLTLHYRHGLTFREIGDVLGLTESRISQLHRAITRRVRGEIQALVLGDSFPFLVVVDAAVEALERLDVPEPAEAAAG